MVFTPRTRNAQRVFVESQQVLSKVTYSLMSLYVSFILACYTFQLKSLCARFIWG